MAALCLSCASVQVLYGLNQRLRDDDVDTPLANIRPVKSVTVALVTGDRGLCGGYNNFVIKKVRAFGLSVHVCVVPMPVGAAVASLSQLLEVEARRACRPSSVSASSRRTASRSTW